MSELAILYDAQARKWLQFKDPLETIEVHNLDRVTSSLDYIEQRVETDGLFAVGFVSYEAAPAFDEALQTKALNDFPLLRFVLFASKAMINLPLPGESLTLPNWQAGETSSTFSGKVDEIQEAIARGETYQVNLTFPLTGDFSHDPWQFFLQLVHGQQAGGAGFLQNKRWAICSVSPELFFYRVGEQLAMRPMKGTTPRGRTLEEDLQFAERLQRSAKNRAENIMILDMVRNDLGRLAPPGRVHTAEICTLEKYPTVWQLTSSATAESTASLAQVFQALFPCASITGAPKARTMQIINRTESTPRRMYTGTFGWLEPGRKAQFNVAIRTALIDRQQEHAIYGVGAGITWDSVGPEEYRECLDKAAVLSQPVSDFALIETLRWAPGKGYFLLPEHLDRLQASATYFEYGFSAERVREYLQTLAGDFPDTPQMVRLLLCRDGSLQGTFKEIGIPRSRELKIALAQEPVDRQSILLYHKTTQRQLYENNLAEVVEADEVVLWNQLGELTECCTANLVIKKNGQLVTPPVSCGLLPGTYRDFLVKRGVLQEQVLTLEDLRDNSHIYLINAVRKWRRAVFHE
jgi:para-aminobenzoate synthetase/4-amino-4-deoxychorismate lyase